MIAGLLLLIAGCIMPNALIGVAGALMLVGTAARWIFFLRVLD